MTPALAIKFALRDFYTYSEPDPLCWHTLEDWGVDFALVDSLTGPIVLHSTTFLEGGGFEFTELGESAFVHPVTADDGETEIDLIAWAARDPSVFGTLLHQASLLGADRVLNPASYYGEKPCPLWRTPLAWLQAGCEGGCVLAAIPAATVLARAPGLLAAENTAHGRELVNGGALPEHKIVVPVDKIRRAA